MDAILPFKRLVQRKKKLYKSAIHDHLDTLQEAVARDTQQKLTNLSRRSVSILVPDYQDITVLNGFTVANLLESKVDERIILVSTDTKQQVAEGAIVDVDEDHKVKIRLDKPLTVTKETNDENESNYSTISNVYQVKLDKNTVLDRKKRIENALLKFKNVSCSLPIHKSLLGEYKDWNNEKFTRARVISINDSIRLKGSQLKAVEESMKKRISLIEGVAGSGKTLVAASLAYSMHKLRNKKILLCSPIQATVDKLTQLLNDAKNVFVVKLSPKKRSNYRLRSENGKSSLESLVRSEIYGRGLRRSRRVYSSADLKNMNCDALDQQATKVVYNSSRWLRKHVENKLLRRADVVCCTLVQAGDPRLQELNFDMLIIDDLQAASEADCMIPLMAKGLKQVTLISEMRREIRSARTTEAKSSPNGYSTSTKPNGLKVEDLKKIANELTVTQAREPGGLFERWLSMGITAVALRNQFRMHETIAAFSNHHFYLSRLKTDREANEELTRQICRGSELEEDSFNWLPNKRCMTAFFDTSLISKASTDGSVDNLVQYITDKLTLEENIHKSKIGIIMNGHLKTKYDFCGINIGTVEDFFGQEREYIILLAKNDDSAEISRGKQIKSIDCNYLKNEDALLIAITRARLGLFIVAELSEDKVSDSSTSIKSQESSPTPEDREENYCESWKALVRYYLANKLVVYKPAIDLQ